MSTWTDKNGLRQRVSVMSVSGDQVAAARRFVATKSTGVVDCRQLLDALGIGPTEAEIAERRGLVDQDSGNDTVIQVEETRTA